MGAAAPASGTSASQGSPVRIGALPEDDLATNVVTLIEAKQAYAANAAVILVASDMLDTLVDMVQPHQKY